MDVHHLNNSELKKIRKNNGCVALRGGIVKDATQQGSSASLMTADEVLDVISRLPGRAEQASDAGTAHTQVKMEDAPKLLRIPESACPTVGVRPPRSSDPKAWDKTQDPVALCLPWE